jgi:hypothetical protein
MMGKAVGVERPFLSLHNHRTWTESLDKMIVVTEWVLYRCYVVDLHSFPNVFT